MRRLTLAFIFVLVMIIPLPSAAGGHCPSIEGRAVVSFYNTNTGSAMLVYDGEFMRVRFIQLGAVETPTGLDIFMVWLFPQGNVVVVEHSVGTDIGNNQVHFESVVEVLEGGEGTWEWSGTADLNRGVARINTLSGDLCID